MQYPREDPAHIPGLRDGVPILGMEKFVREDSQLSSIFETGAADWVLAPNDRPSGDASASRARHHGQFDDDPATLQASLSRVLAEERVEANFAMQRLPAAAGA